MNKNEKLTQGIYYSCSHQNLEKNKCSTCANDREQREKNEEAKRDPNLIDRDPIITNKTALPCEGNCGKLNFVEIHSEGGSDESKYIIKEDCYQHDSTHYTCASCYEKNSISKQEQSGEDSNPIKSNQIQSNPIKSNQIQSNPIKSNQIQSNPIKSNQIQSNSVEDDKKSYLPWILGGVGVVSLVGVIAYFTFKSKKRGEE